MEGLFHSLELITFSGGPFLLWNWKIYVVYYLWNIVLTSCFLFHPYLLFVKDREIKRFTPYFDISVKIIFFIWIYPLIFWIFKMLYLLNQWKLTGSILIKIDQHRILCHSGLAISFFVIFDFFSNGTLRKKRGLRKNRPL